MFGFRNKPPKKFRCKIVRLQDQGQWAFRLAEVCDDQIRALCFAVYCSLCGGDTCAAQTATAAQSSIAVQPSAAPPAATKEKGNLKDKTTEGKLEHGGGLNIETIKLPSQIASTFAFPLKCDADGNLYFITDPDGFEAIQKLSTKGEQLGLYQAKSPDLKIDNAGYFSLSPDGEVYQVIMAHEITRYVFAYNADGSVKSEIKLQTGFPFTPSRLAVFPSGDLLVSGLKYDKDRTAAMWPFNGIFSSDGALRKEITLKDDESIRAMAGSGDPKVTSPQHPSFNHAVTQGAAETAADGNVYLMRRISPAIFYAISPGGAVVRRFTVNAGEEDFMPVITHIAGSRIAILFRQGQTRKEIIKVVDLEGHEVATYEEPVIDGRQALGLAFACYASNPERFTFLTEMEDHRLGLAIATPQ